MNNLVENIKNNFLEDKIDYNIPNSEINSIFNKEIINNNMTNIINDSYNFIGTQLFLPNK